MPPRVPRQGGSQRGGVRSVLPAEVRRPVRRRRDAEQRVLREARSEVRRRLPHEQHYDRARSDDRCLRARRRDPARSAYPAPVSNKCSAGKKKCVSKKAACKLGCYSGPRQGHPRRYRLPREMRGPSSTVAHTVEGLLREARGQIPRVAVSRSTTPAPSGAPWTRSSATSSVSCTVRRTERVPLTDRPPRRRPSPAAAARTANCTAVLAAVGAGRATSRTFTTNCGTPSSVSSSSRDRIHSKHAASTRRRTTARRTRSIGAPAPASATIPRRSPGQQPGRAASSRDSSSRHEASLCDVIAGTKLANGRRGRTVLARSPTSE